MSNVARSKRRRIKMSLFSHLPAILFLEWFGIQAICIFIVAHLRHIARWDCTEPSRHISTLQSLIYHSGTRHETFAKRTNRPMYIICAQSEKSSGKTGTDVQSACVLTVERVAIFRKSSYDRSEFSMCKRPHFPEGLSHSVQIVYVCVDLQETHAICIQHQTCNLSWFFSSALCCVA